MPVKYIKSGICRNLAVCPSNPLRVCNSPETAKIKRLSRGNLEKIETRRDLKSMDGNGIEKNSAMEFASERKVFSSLSTWFSSSFSRRARGGDVAEDDTDEFCVLILRPERQKRFLSRAVLAAAAAARLVVVVVEKVQKDRDEFILVLDALSRRLSLSLSLSLSVVCEVTRVNFSSSRAG